MTSTSATAKAMPSWHGIHEEHDGQWALLPTEEPVTPELENEIREELKKAYHFLRRQNFRDYIRVHIINSTTPILSDEVPKSLFLKQYYLRMFCNKATTLYGSYSSDKPIYRFSGPIFRGICSEWMRYHDNIPKMDFGHFFSSPVTISEKGPTKIAEIIQAHKSICDLVALQLSSANRPHNPCTTGQCNFLCNYRLVPLCRAIITLYDEKASWGGTGRIRDIDLWLPTQSLLLVRTNDESDLSMPISFANLEKHSLPLSRNDLDAKAEGIDVIRVPLPVAVRFIAELEEREYVAFPELRNTAVEKLICPNHEIGDAALNVDTWVDWMMQDAKDKGIDFNPETWAAVRRAKAVRRGEVFYTSELVMRWQGQDVY